MKFSIFVIAVSLVGSNSFACVEPSADEFKTSLKLASEHFVDKVMTRKGVETFLTTFGMSVVDCHDYDSEFDHLDIQLSWRQKVKGTYQSCDMIVSTNYQAELDISEEMNCVSDKK